MGNGKELNYIWCLAFTEENTKTKSETKSWRKNSANEEIKELELVKNF